LMIVVAIVSLPLKGIVGPDSKTTANRAQHPGGLAGRTCLV